MPMEAARSFAPFAARLAAYADEIRPADGAPANWTNFVALVWCAMFAMLITLCEALDARAAEVARLAAAPARLEGAARPVAAVGPGRAAMPVSGRRSRLARAVDSGTMGSERDEALVGTAGPAFGKPRLVWAREPGPSGAAGDPPWRYPRVAPPRKAAGRRGIWLAYSITLS